MTYRVALLQEAADDLLDLHEYVAQVSSPKAAASPALIAWGDIIRPARSFFLAAAIGLCFLAQAMHPFDLSLPPGHCQLQ